MDVTVMGGSAPSHVFCSAGIDGTVAMPSSSSSSCFKRHRAFLCRKNSVNNGTFVKRQFCRSQASLSSQQQSSQFGCASRVLQKSGSRSNWGIALRHPLRRGQETTSSSRIGLSSSDDTAFVDKGGGDDILVNVRSSLNQFLSKTHDDFTREVAILAFPALMAQAIEPLAQLLETAFIGRIGAVELGAVGVSISAFNYVSKTFNIPLLNVTTSFVAEDDASNSTVATPSAGHEGELSRTTETNQSGKRVLPAVSSSLVLGVALGLVEALLLGFGGGAFLSMMGVTADSVMKAPAGRYLALRAVGCPAVVISLALQGVFRGFKDTKIPLYATVVGSVSNIVLGPILMFGLGYGITGAAIAYVISQYMMMAYLLWNLNKRVILLPPKFSDLKLDRFLKSGGLLLGRTISILSTMTLSTSMAARQGALPMAAHQVCMQLWLAASLLSDSLAIAVQALIAGAFAKGDYDRAKLAAYRVLQMGLALGLLMAVILASSSNVLSKMFTNDVGVLKVMAAIMPFVAFTQPINSLAFVFDGIHYGASDFSYVAYSMMFTAVVSSAVLFVAPALWGLSGVWIGLTVVMGLRAAAGFSRLLLETGPWSLGKQKQRVAHTGHNPKA